MQNGKIGHAFSSLSSMSKPRVMGFAGYSGSGKTTLIEQLIPMFSDRGLSVSLIKHAHHDFDIDQPGKDSFRHRKAGCKEVLISSDQRWALMHELRGEPEPSLDELLGRLDRVDWVLIEGFKHARVPKLEVHRAENGKPLLYPDDKDIIAVAAAPVLAAPIPSLNLDRVEEIFAFILEQPC